MKKILVLSALLAALIGCQQKEQAAAPAAPAADAQQTAPAAPAADQQAAPATDKN